MIDCVRTHLLSVYSIDTIHQSAITLNPLTDDVNNIDYMVTLVPLRRWDILGSK